MITPWDLSFIKESNRIESIHREPTGEEIEEYARFMAQDEITLRDMIQFVSVYEPDAELRDRPGMNVTIGDHFPPWGDITVKTRLLDILTDANAGHDPYGIHVRYETLHAFSDCNGRSGRMLWAWQMSRSGEDYWLRIGFLRSWYDQSFTAARKRPGGLE